ncbi:hypothetical protein [Streptomyces sp. MUM 203J]|uniref:hypothetical protein n=1 Tax=Streptomyces sp. MUM 203J TaxID=2791990 RepID=UPI001F03E222|nr:hypothetical protein [Streptomyces sp. MUM 203J]
MGAEPPVAWCPSGAPDRAESVVLGVRSGPEGQVSYLAEPVPAAQVVDALPEGVPPTRVLRFASHCVSDCGNRVGTSCGLVDRVTAVPPPSGAEGRPVPRCHLRAQCKWWHQSGVAACHRCPAVSTATLDDDPLAKLVADPSTTREQLETWIASQAR